MHRSVDHSWRNRVYTNAIFCVLHRETSRDGLDPAFGDHRDRSSHSGYRMVDQCRRYANDASARFLRHYLFNLELGDVYEAFQVGGSERFEVLGRIVCKGLSEEYTRVVDECIDRLELACRCLDNLCSRSDLANVSVDQRQLIRRYECAGFCDVPRVRDDRVAPFQKSLHDAGSDALRSTGYDDCLGFVQHGRTPLYLVRSFAIDTERARSRPGPDPRPVA